MSVTTIKAGQHSSFQLPSIHFGKYQGEYIVEMTESCYYKELSWENDWNKILGWSYGYHHQNSIRLAWRCRRGGLEYALYCYEDGKRAIRKIIRAWNPLRFDVRLHHEDDVLFFESDALGADLSMFLKRPAFDWGYELNPYFGGNYPAPHDVKIQVIKLL